jgi:ATP-dependent Clp protease adaptor protein ClpS
MSDPTLKEIKKTAKKLMNERPRKYCVVFLNDDVTSFEFVINALVSRFHVSSDEAENMAYKVHTEGLATVGSFTCEIAETLAYEVMKQAAEIGFPLKLTTEPV